MRGMQGDQLLFSTITLKYETLFTTYDYAFLQHFMFYIKKCFKLFTAFCHISANSRVSEVTMLKHSENYLYESDYCKEKCSLIGPITYLSHYSSVGKLYHYNPTPSTIRTIKLYSCDLSVIYHNIVTFECDDMCDII
jgi:hypothetical protein